MNATIYWSTNAVCYTGNFIIRMHGPYCIMRFLMGQLLECQLHINIYTGCSWGGIFWVDCVDKQWIGVWISFCLWNEGAIYMETHHCLQPTHDQHQDRQNQTSLFQGLDLLINLTAIYIPFLLQLQNKINVCAPFDQCYCVLGNQWMNVEASCSI